jgi:hypothetical protein
MRADLPLDGLAGAVSGFSISSLQLLQEAGWNTCKDLAADAGRDSEIDRKLLTLRSRRSGLFAGTLVLKYMDEDGEIVKRQRLHHVAPPTASLTQQGRSLGFSTDAVCNLATQLAQHI